MKKTDILKTINYMKRNGIRHTVSAAKERLTAKYDSDYSYELPSASILQMQRETASVENLKISILVPAYETPERFLNQLLSSVWEQTYQDWELILADAGETSVVRDTVEQFCKAHEREDTARIKYHKLLKNAGISENTNAALSYATGNYTGLLDHDDFLAPDALYEMVMAIQAAREKSTEPLFLYSDEDKFDETGGTYFTPNRKYKFNLDLILSNNYICHFLVMKTELLKTLKLRKEYDGAQDYDLVLRAASEAMAKQKSLCDAGMAPAPLSEQILHIPRVLYHWRCHSASTAANPASKSYAYEAGKSALQAFLMQQDWQAEAEDTMHVGFYRVHYIPDLLSVRQDVAAVGGSVVNRNGKITSGMIDENGRCPFKDMPVSYAGPANIASIVQDCAALDARTMILRPEMVTLYEEMIGLPYLADLTGRDRKYCNRLDEAIWRQRSMALSEKLQEGGKRLVWDPQIQVMV